MEIQRPKQVKILDTIRIKDSGPFFPGLRGVVAYIGEEGISVTMVDVEGFDDYVPIRWDEFDVIE